MSGLVTSLLSASLEVSGASGDLVDRIVEFGADVEVDFYRQVSQIIPVLLLALAIERRVFEAGALSRIESPRWAVQLVAGAVLLAIVAAELFSLYTVATDEVEAYFFPVTAGALLMLLALLVAVALGAFRAREA